MIEQLPVGRSAPVRNVFFATAAIGALLVFWIRSLRGSDLRGITPVFNALFTMLDYLPALVMLGVLLVAVLVPARAWIPRLLEALGAHPVAVAVAVTLLHGAGAVFVYFAHPLSMDEYSPYLQSQAFAAGHLTGAIPTDLIDWLIPRENQNSFFTVSRDSGAIASGYWPGFALLLAPFTLLGIPWACNPVLSGLTVLALHRLALRLFGDAQSAGLVLLLTIASPVFFADGVSFYSMTAHMLCNVVFVTLVLEPTPRRLFAAGVVGSVALTLHNPVPHMLLAAPWLIWLVTRPGGWRRILPLAAGYLPLCLVLGVGWFWYVTTWLHRGPIDQAILAEVGRPGGGLASMFGPPNEWTLLARLIGVAKVWLWAVPGLLVFAGVGFWRWRADVRIKLLAASAACTFFGYFVVLVDQGHGWGYRYFHSAWFVLPLLAAALVAPPPGAPSARESLDDLRAFVVACALLYLPVGTLQRAANVRAFVGEMLAQEPQYAGAEARVIFIDARRMFYGNDLVQNDALLRGPVVRMVSRGRDANAALMARIEPNYRRVVSGPSGEVWAAAP